MGYMVIYILSLKSEKSMRAVVTGGIGGVVDTFGKSLKYATCFGKLTLLNAKQESRDRLQSHFSISRKNGLLNNHCAEMVDLAYILIFAVN